MAGRLTVIILALVIILHSPASVVAPVMFPGVVQEHQKPEPEPETMTVEATAYTWTGNRTVTGTWPSRGTIAVDPEVIPLGSKLHVEGYGEGIAEDTGGLVKGNVIDVYLPTEPECWQWGRKSVEVRIIEEANHD